MIIFRTCMHTSIGLIVFILIFGSGQVFGNTTYPDVTGFHLNEMPESEKTRIRQLIQSHQWAAEAYDTVTEKAEKDGYWAAFLYAMEGDEKYLTIARDWLTQYSEKGGDLGKRALEADDAFFEGGQPWLGDVYYRVDTNPLLAYAWIWKWLSEAERAAIEFGIMTSARFRMNAMDRWTQTANLVFKPTYMVAVAGLVTGNPELIDWGFYRKPGSAIGGYFPVLNVMLKDSGLWGEAPIYPIAHLGLLVGSRMSEFLSFVDGGDWYNRAMPSGGSIRGLMDYYIDAAYPVEITGYGKGQFRIATYGDGATGPSGDLYLANPAGPHKWHLHEELAKAFDLTGDSRYAVFLSYNQTYQPDLLDHPSLPDQSTWPAAPSTVWPEYGLAMLRSDESPNYWTNPEAIAVFQVLSKGYGHDHRDKFSITLHGAGRLLYPDYNAIQYENPAIGWTRNTIAHNTLMVDEQDTADADPTDMRHQFSPAVKFLSTSASEVFKTVGQTRTLMLTSEYLLDIFQAESETPHVYDYLLHSFGRPEPVAAGGFQSGTFLSARFNQVQNKMGMSTDQSWQIDFIIDEAQLKRREEAMAQLLGESQEDNYGPEWYGHISAVRVTMASSPNTGVVYGEGPQALDMLVVRRQAIAETAFVSTHEPYEGGQTPRIKAVTVLARTQNAIAVRIDADEFTDYAAVALGPGQEDRIHSLSLAEDGSRWITFRNFTYLRVDAGGRITADGGLTGFRLPERADELIFNNESKTISKETAATTYGNKPSQFDKSLQNASKFPLPVSVDPSPMRMSNRSTRGAAITIENSSASVFSGSLQFQSANNFTFSPGRLNFGPLSPGETVQLPFQLSSNGADAGVQNLFYEITYRTDENSNEIRSLPQGFPVTVEAVLQTVYRDPDPSVYRIYSPAYVADAKMLNGAITYLQDDSGKIWLNGVPLFTLADNEENPLLEADTAHAFTWIQEVPAVVLANAQDQCRWRAAFDNQGITFTMDRDWTQFDPAIFTIPGEWNDDATIQWEYMEDDEGRALEPTSGPKSRIKFAELGSANSSWILRFQFTPAQDVNFTETGMTFQMGTLNGETWRLELLNTDPPDGGNPGNNDGQSDSGGGSSGSGGGGGGGCFISVLDAATPNKNMPKDSSDKR